MCSRNTTTITNPKSQDSLAARSHARAAAAQRSGRFDSQIVPVHTTWKDPKTGEVKNVIIDKDDGIREDVTVEALGKLPAVFKKAGGRVYAVLFVHAY